jgi:hypothetical protein
VPFARKFGDMSRRLFWQRTLKGSMENRAAAIAQYNRHIEDVRAAVPPGKLLIFTVDQGWAPLCRFLGVPEPSTPFPNVNDRAEIKGTITGFAIGAYLLLAAVAAFAIAVIYALSGIFS